VNVVSDDAHVVGERVRPAAGPLAGDAWQHVAGLDGLRALAVVAVLLFHAGHLQGGFLGVDLFFALSGFLITSLLLRDAHDDGIRLTAFWGRRFRRLLPAVFVMIVVVAAWAWAFGEPSDLDGVRRDGLWALAYVANWHFISETTGYWASFAQPSVFDHLWSLAVEEQFYVVWPLIVLAVWTWSKRPDRDLVLVAGGLVAASFVAMTVLYEPGADPTRVYMGTDTRAASILVGAVLATAPARHVASRAAHRLGRRLDILIAVLAAGVVWSWFAVDGASSDALYRGGLLLHSATCAVIVLAVVTAPACRAAGALGWAPLLWIGTRSYALYLWHWPLYVILDAERTGLDDPWLTVVRLAAAAAFAEASYRMVEFPVRNRATWARGRRAIPALAVAVAVVAGVLLVLPRPEREIAAFDPSAVDVDVAGPAGGVDQPAPPSPSVATRSTVSTTAASGSPKQTKATTTTGAVTTTTTPAVAPVTTVAPPRPAIGRVLWTGDSIAYDLAPAITAALTDAGLAVENTAYPGVRLVGAGDLSLLTRLPDELAVMQPDLVVFQISVWDARAGGDELTAALAELHAQVRATGAYIVFVPAPPTIDVPTDALLRDVTARAAQLAADDPAGTWLLDPAGVWSPSFLADLDGDGVPERKNDGVHVCPSGAARFALWLTAELAARFDGIAPTPPEQWAAGDWVVDERYDQPVGACAPLG
jgi:peptidoglycan/LPS O-acetylase OafA/YrhL/lysophospholipase L1-like esterase